MFNHLFARTAAMATENGGSNAGVVLAILLAIVGVMS